MDRKALSPRELKTRLKRLHRASGSAAKLHVWFANVAHVRPLAVARWLDGRRSFRGPALALLEHLELNGNAAPSSAKETP